jgi:hypothetical protein
VSNKTRQNKTPEKREKMAKNTLPTKVKNYIVVRLAFRLTPSCISKRVEKLFDYKITRQGVNAYNPLKKAGKNLSAELRYLFFTIRELFDEETERKTGKLKNKSVLTQQYAGRNSGGKNTTSV